MGRHDSSRTPAESESGGSRERGLWHYLGLALSGALLVLVIALAAAVVVIPKIVGGIPLTVLTSSMIPHFPPGTLIVDLPAQSASLRIGDVATYQIESGKPGVITHRIIAIHSSSDGSRTFQFKGDNNSQPDVDEVSAEQVMGKVWFSLPYLGYLNNAINGENRKWIIPAVAGLLFVYFGYTVASAIVNRRSRRGRLAARNQSRAISATTAPVPEMRSPGESSMSNPRRPPLT